MRGQEEAVEGDDIAGYYPCKKKAKKEKPAGAFLRIV
jgi:hypothetical protein